MRFDSAQIAVATRLANFASIYRNAYINGENFKRQFNDNYTALQCFLENYAYERQGSAKAYPLIAKQTIEKIFHGKLEKVTHSQITEAWATYTTIAAQDYNGLKTNASHNPMHNHQGILSTMADYNVSNIANYVKKLIEEGNTKSAHTFLDGIRGIGTKIASFYLRDIVCLAEINENQIRDSFYLQPLDTWLEQTFSLIMNKSNVSLEDKQKTFVELCREAGCSSIAFNQGAWVLGSQIAGDFNTFKKIAFGEDSKKTLLRLIEDEEAYLLEIKKVASQIN
jgi:hypothetical protein